MSSAKCFRDGCTRKLYGKCECEGVVLFCKKHALKHLKIPTSNRHQCLEPYFIPAEEIKQPIIAKLKKFKKDISIFRIDAITNANQIIKKFNSKFGKYIDQINKVEARCNKMIKILESNEKVLDIATEDDLESVLKLNASDIQHMHWDISKCYLNYQEISEAIKSIFKIPFHPLRRYRSKEISFFRDKSKDFVTINLNTFQISSSVTLPITENIHHFTTSCILPDKTYFYCCNGTTSSGYTFAIDKDKNVKELQNSKVNKYADPIFYNNFIYLIGGINNLSERYDIKRNIWKSMAPFTQNLNLNYTGNVLYKDLILITGYYIQKILIYSISQNNYQEVQNLVLNASIYKLMLKGNNRIYVLEKGGRTFESAEGDISSWAQIGNNNMWNNSNQSSVVRYKGCLYFVIYEQGLWKFDLSSKQASHIKSFK